MSRPAEAVLVDASVAAVREAFRGWLADFNRITARARQRFESQDWPGGRADVIERLDLHTLHHRRLLALLRVRLGDRMEDRGLWRGVKSVLARALDGAPNAELEQSFFNSTTRRIFAGRGLDPGVQFDTHETARRSPGGARLWRRVDLTAGAEHAIAGVLRGAALARWRDLEGDARAVAKAIDAVMGRRTGAAFEALEVLEAPFFRNKGAYLVGRLSGNGRFLPFVLPLVQTTEGAAVDAVLVDEDEVSIVFSFTRSHFHVVTDCPGDTIEFLKTLLPRKPVAELYIALGFHKHGKTELYRDLMRHLAVTTESFVEAPGDRGLVMLVFMLPGHDRVFKIIRDVFAYPKSTTEREVRERYRLVFERDRVGRLVEAQAFDGLRFEASRFSEPLLAELGRSARKSVRVRDGQVHVERLYTERRVRPLNLYVREVAPAEAERAIVDYGHAIRELAAANIFPGDFLLKNFGVTRHGRVVFYDYDELCLLTDVRFRRMPPPRTHEDELADEPWFEVRDGDVFPEEFRTFLDIPPDLVEPFERHHAELFDADWWQEMRQRQRKGELVDFFPYPRERRLTQHR